MLVSACIGANDLEEAGKFYDAVLATIGMKRIITETHEIGYGQSEEKISLWVVIPYNEQAASFGNGTQMIFSAPNEESVNAFHQAILDNGGSNEGNPGPRDYQKGYYGAYGRDPIGNKLHAFVINN